MKIWPSSLAAALVCSVAFFVGAGGQAEMPASAAPRTPDRVMLTPQQAAAASRQKLLPQGTTSLLNVTHRLNYGEYLWNDRGIASGTVTVRVNLKSQILSVYRGGAEIGTSVILYGADGHDTPVGRFPILEKDRDHWSSTYDAPMPYTLRLTADGVSIHGADVKRARATHGCIGVPLDFAKRLFEASHAGDMVEIVTV